MSIWTDKLGNTVLGVEIERFSFALSEFEVPVGNPSEGVLCIWICGYGAQQGI